MKNFKNKIICDDCIKAMKQMPENSVDAVICDPPYHLTSIVKRFGKKNSAPAKFGTDGAFARASKGFMGKTWDGGDIAFKTEVWEKCLRVLKPGGYLLSFGGVRTEHRMACAIEDAGFEIRDKICWVYKSGFPKSYNISKGIDAKIKTGKCNPKGINKSELSKNTGQEVKRMQPNNGILGDKKEVLKKENAELETEEAKKWEGFGTALKPAYEFIILARKSTSEKTIVENVLKHGTGGLNIDGCRIPYKSEEDFESAKHGLDGKQINDANFGLSGSIGKINKDSRTKQGRFPANIVCQDDALNDGTVSKGWKGQNHNTEFNPYGGNSLSKSSSKRSGYHQGFPDSGSNSRYFDIDIWNKKHGLLQFPKASKAEKNKGCEEMDIPEYRWNNGGEMKQIKNQKGNFHPTVKNLALMSYLITLVSKPNDIILDPFAGSGSTLVAAKQLQRQFIGIELTKEYIPIAEARLKAIQKPII